MKQTYCNTREHVYVAIRQPISQKVRNSTGLIKQLTGEINHKLDILPCSLVEPH